GATGVGGAGMIVGEPGLGKSRLLAELAATDEAGRVRWAEGRSVPAGRTLRYHPFVDLLRALLHLDDRTSDPFAQLEQASAPALGGDAADALPFLASVLGLAMPEALATRVAAVPGDVLDRLTLRALRTLLAGLARARPGAGVRGRLLGGPFVGRASRHAAAALARPSHPLPRGLPPWLPGDERAAPRDRPRDAARGPAARDRATPPGTGRHAPLARDG